MPTIQGNTPPQKEPNANSLNGEEAQGLGLDMVTTRGHLKQDQVQRAKINPQHLRPSDILALQSTIGNAAVNRMLAESQRQPSPPSASAAAPVIQPKLHASSAQPDRGADQYMPSIMRPTVQRDRDEEQMPAKSFRDELSPELRSSSANQSTSIAQPQAPKIGKVGGLTTDTKMMSSVKGLSSNEPKSAVTAKQFLQLEPHRSGLALQRSGTEDPTQMTITPEWAETLTESELSQAIERVRNGVRGLSPGSPEYESQIQNLQILESKVAKSPSTQSTQPDTQKAQAPNPNNPRVRQLVASTVEELDSFIPSFKVLLSAWLSVGRLKGMPQFVAELRAKQHKDHGTYFVAFLIAMKNRGDDKICRLMMKNMAKQGVVITESELIKDYPLRFQIADYLSGKIQETKQILIDEPEDSIWWVLKATLVDTFYTLEEGFVDALRVGKGSEEAAQAYAFEKNAIDRWAGVVKGLSEDFLRLTVIFGPAQKLAVKSAEGMLSKQLANSADDVIQGFSRNMTAVETQAATQAEKQAARIAAEAAEATRGNVKSTLVDNSQKLLKSGPTPKALPPGPSPKALLPSSTSGFPKPWKTMSKAEKAAFQHAYSRHAKELGLPNWKGSEAELLQQRFNTVVAEIRKNAGIPKIVKKPVGVKGSGIPASSQDVRYYETEILGTKYYYYETLDGRFVSAGKSL